MTPLGSESKERTKPHSRGKGAEGAEKTFSFGGESRQKGGDKPTIDLQAQTPGPGKYSHLKRGRGEDKKTTTVDGGKENLALRKDLGC